MRNNTKWLSFFLITAMISEPVFAARKPTSVARPDASLIQKAQELASPAKGAKVDEAITLLTKEIESETDSEKRGLLRMSLAVILFNTAKDKEAEEQFTKALEEKLRISDYAYFYRGILRKKSSRWAEARADLQKVLGSVAPRDTEVDARLHLAEVYDAEKNWKQAARQYLSLRKTVRNSPEYPKVIFGLARSEIKSGRKAAACRWVKELYSKYPTYHEVRDWGADLAKNKIDGDKTGCASSTRDLKTRVRRLQWGGESEQASKELKGLQEAAGKSGSYAVDSLLANHLINDGQVDEAMKLLMRHYEAQKQSSSYLLLLGKAASRAGDYKVAINAYQSAYDLAPKSARSAGALFQAAFTSYQIQDYDGASQRFGKLVKLFPRSSLTKDSRWYMAWIRYLRGDYVGAQKDFETQIKSATRVIRRKGRRIVRTDAQAVARARYWLAMTFMKMGKTKEATENFYTLIRDPAIGYYAVTSYYRLLSIPGAKLPPGIESRLGLKKTDNSPSATPSEEELLVASESVEEAQKEFEDQESAGIEDADESESGGEGVELADVDSETDAQEGEANQAEDSQVADASSNAPGTKGPIFVDPGLASRFERARDLKLVGLVAAARLELREIEKKARKAEDRRLLMSEYVEVENYYRASYMGEVGFGQQRLLGGLKGEGRTYWEYAYPRAWEKVVLSLSKEHSVPEEFIWSIMRAESHFRQDAQSVVGASGLMQLMPFTARQVASLLNLNGFQTHSLLEPETNIQLGTRYLRRLMDKFSGSIPLVAASYNAGPHRSHAWVKNFGSLDMDEFIEHIPFLETRNYVKKVVRNYQIYSLLYSGGAHSLKWLVQPIRVELSDAVPSKEVW